MQYNPMVRFSKFTYNKEYEEFERFPLKLVWKDPIIGNLGFGYWLLLRHLLIVHFRKLTMFDFKFGSRLRQQFPLKKLT